MVTAIARLPPALFFLTRHDRFYFEDKDNPCRPLITSWPLHCECTMPAVKICVIFFRDGDSLPFIIRRQKKKTRTAECLWKATRVESSGKRLNAFARARAHTHKHTSRGSAEDAFPSAQHVAWRPLFPLAYATKQRHKTNERLLKHRTDASCMF